MCFLTYSFFLPKMLPFSSLSVFWANWNYSGGMLLRCCFLEVFGFEIDFDV